MLQKLGYQAFRDDVLAASDAIPFPATEAAPSEQDYAALYDSYSAGRPQTDYDGIHAVRFRETARAFGRYLERGRSVVELGGHGRIGEFAADVLGATSRSYEAELRDPFDLPDGEFDIVLCLEVIEHLKDRRLLESDESDQGCWNYSGALNVLSESHRILKPGGVLLITTPNANSLDTIKCILVGDHPFIFDPHVRELTPRQVKAFGEHVGFRLEAFGTFFAWGVCDDALRQKLVETIAVLGFDPRHRGDDAYYVFHKV